MTSLSLQLHNNLEELNTLAEALESLEDRWGLSTKTILELNLVLDELCTNIINYAYQDMTNHRINIQVDLVGDFINIIVKDDGKAFNPIEKKPADTSLPIEKREIGGLGIHLVKRYTDSISYQRVDEKNILIMKKRVSIIAK